MKFDDRNMSKGITIIMHRESAHSKNLCQRTNNDIEYEAPRMSMRSMKTYYKMIGGKEHNTVCILSIIHSHLLWRCILCTSHRMRK